MSRVVARYGLTLALSLLVAQGCAQSIGKPQQPSSTLTQHTNRLSKESSPYLLQHAHNPVDWFPWGAEAFDKARREDKPVFLSVGYAACHWCHVMERESFENEEIARILNAGFVSIKVDREERPDVDDVYMTAVQMTTGSGGWPMSVFLTPGGKPFFGGTYFRPNDFKELLGKVAEVWKTRRADVDRSAEGIAAAVKKQMEAAAAPRMPGRDMLGETVAALRADFDLANGGFGHAPKFPPHNSFSLLFYAAEHDKKPDALQMALATLDKMALGGIHDHLGGGFHRYSTDAVWLVPHFEKMLYDNALLARAYTEAWRITKKSRYREAAMGALDWALREMRGPEGGFYSSLDADSEGAEGKFYTWTKAEILRALGPKDGEAFCKVYDVTVEGNYKEQSTAKATGRNILYLRQPIDEATKLAATAPQAIAGMQSKLLSVRDKRIHPGLDDKRLAGWNGLMIGALARAGQIFGEARYIAAAQRAADFVHGSLTRDGRLQRRWRGGQSESRPIPAYLEDYAYLIEGLLDLAEATQRPSSSSSSRSSSLAGSDPTTQRPNDPTTQATRLADEMVRLFADPKGGFFDSAEDHEKLLVRAKSVYDQALPGPNAIAVRALLRLARMTGESRYREVALGTLKAFGGQAMRIPRAAQTMVLASALYHDSSPISQIQNPKSEIRNPKSQIVSVSATAPPTLAGAKTELAITLTIAKGWHINSSKPLDSALIPTRVEVEPSGSVVGGDPIYPTARRVRLGFSQSPVAVYEGIIVVRVPLNIPKTAEPGPHPLTIRIRYQPCNDKVCQAPATVSLPANVTIKRK